MRNWKSSRSLLALYVAAGMLAFVGWVGVLALVFNTVPSLIPRWMFFALGLASLTGTAVPFIRYLNRRFEHGLASSVLFLRRSILVGVFGTTLAWLQIGRSLSWGSSMLLAGVFISIELLLELRERSRYVSGASND